MQSTTSYSSFSGPISLVMYMYGISQHKYCGSNCQREDDVYDAIKNYGPYKSLNPAQRQLSTFDILLLSINFLPFKHFVSVCLM